MSKTLEEVRNKFDYYKKYKISFSPGRLNVNSEDYINFKGKIYLLLDGNVFSSAEKFTSFAKDQDLPH